VTQRKSTVTRKEDSGVRESEKEGGGRLTCFPGKGVSQQPEVKEKITKDPFKIDLCESYCQDEREVVPVG